MNLIRFSIFITILLISFNLKAQYTIPVVFHVIHNNGPENIPDQTILDGLEQLNQRLANEGSYFNETGHNVPIRFCLASVNPEGQPETGIQRIQSPLTIFDGNETTVA